MHILKRDLKIKIKIMCEWDVSEILKILLIFYEGEEGCVKQFPNKISTKMFTKPNMNYELL